MSRIKILYVEDEPFLGKIVKESLESRDFEVTMISDGGKVLLSFQQNRPDICVLDIMLPNKDGYAIAKSIRELNAAIPIIFVTAKTQTEDVLKGFESGGNDFLKKPFSMEELIVRVNNLLFLTGKLGKSPVDAIELGVFQFFPQRYELRNGSALRKLSHRETMLLHILSENKNATVGRKEILLRVWGDDSFFNSRNLDVYITKLRDYLRGDSTVQINTIKGIGYHFQVG
jgi:DNA-binding response OmpR family regulator